MSAETITSSGPVVRVAVPQADLEFTSTLRAPRVAYFSMEVALGEEIPTYSGGLGILAGDTLRSAADLGVPMVGITLLHRQGYFRQRLDAQGNQTEEPVEWNPSDELEPMEARVAVTIEGRPVAVGAWRYLIHGVNGHIVPLYFLDTVSEENSEWDQKLTHQLYGGDEHYRLCQEFLLGVAGIAMLRALGHADIETYHMNEGHSALLVLPLIEEEVARNGRRYPTGEDLTAIRRRCVFTTHTPIPAGHDAFPGEMMRQVLGDDRSQLLFSTGFSGADMLNMTHLALHHSNYVNGVAMRHGEVSQAMFPKYSIKALTNGVHASTWTTYPFRELFDREIPEWRHDNVYLRYAISIPLEDVRKTHVRAKQSLFRAIEDWNGVKLDENIFTIGFARRATGYKRADLLFTDVERLKEISQKFGGIQIVYGGKAHPRDQEGKEGIRRIFEAAKTLAGYVRVIYVENYNFRWGAFICGGVDLWLNTPERTREASGTSGMKAALNGVPSFSVLDGWWIEGHLEGVTGWAIEGADAGDEAEAASVYDKLERIILPMYHNEPDRYADIMRSAIALNGSFFNTQRMLLQYIFNAYNRNGRK